MAIQYNDVTAIGNAFEIHTEIPVIGVQSVTGFTDVVLNETGSRFFAKEFRYSTNGITYSDWLELTNENLQNTFVNISSIFGVHYRYTRAGTDTTGILTFVSIQLTGIIVEVSNPRIFTDLYFNKFFNYNDSSVLNWALNVLDKLYKRGIVANYMERGQEGVSDDDYIAFFGALTHFMAILVRYAREFQDFTLNDILLSEYLKQKGVFVNDGMNLSSLQLLLSNVYIVFLERGTNEIAKEAGEGGRAIDGELLRLIRKGEFDEFIWGLIEPEKTIWNVNNNSPLYKGTKGSVNLIKAYEFTQDVILLANYPLIESSYVSIFTDSSKEVIRILNADSPSGTIISGIGDAENQNKLILIDSRLSYEVTFQVRQAALGDYFSLKVNLYDKNEVLLTDSPISAISGAFTNTAIDTESLLQNDVYYSVRLILFNENIFTDATHILDIGFGNHFIINNSLAKYMSIELGVETTDGGTWDGANDLRVYDFKVRPLISPIPNAFVMVPNIITSFMDNNSEQTNRVVQNAIIRYLIPYNSILKNQYLDELFVPAGTPLSIIVSFTDETISGAENGTITIVAVGGQAPYQYSIDNGVTFQSTGIFTDLAPASYDVLVEDAATVQVTDTIVIAVGGANLDFLAFVTSASRLDVSDGVITVLASGGTPPYFYSRNGVNFFASNIFTGLAVGNYTIYVRDTAAIEVNKPVTVSSIRDRTVTVNVVDELAVAIDSVSVVVIEETYLTNASGVVIIYLDDSSYIFAFSKSGYASLKPTIVITSSQTINIVMQTFYSITFNVTSDSVGVTDVLIETTLVPSGQAHFSIQTPSGSGTVIKDDIIAGDYRFTISKAGYRTRAYPSSQTTFTVNSDEVANITLEALLTLSYNVKSSSGGANLLGARIVTTSTPAGQVALNVTTDSSGNAVSSDLRAGLYSFNISRVDYFTGIETNFNLTADDLLNIVLDPTNFTLSVHVNAIISGAAPVNLNSAIVSVIGVQTNTANSSGDTSFSLPANTYTVRASHSGYETVQQNITFSADDSISFDLRNTVSGVRALLEFISIDPVDYTTVQVRFNGPTDVTVSVNASFVAAATELITGDYNVEVLVSSVVVRTQAATVSYINQVIEIIIHI